MFRIIYDYDDGYPTYGITNVYHDEKEARRVYYNLTMSDFCSNIELFEDNLIQERGIENEI